MKKLFLLGSFILLALVACEKKSPEATNDYVYIKAGINDTPTKAVFTIAHGLYWSDGDRIGLVRQDDNAETIVSSAASITNEYRTATFGILASQLESGKTYRAYYPEYEGGSGGGWATDWKHAGWYVNSAQTQYNSGQLDNGRFFLWGEDEINYSSTDQNVNITFNLMGTIIKFLVYGSEDAGEEVTSVAIEQTNDLTSKSNIVAGNLYSNETEYSEEAGRFKVTVSLQDFTEPANAIKSTANGIFAVILPNHNYAAVEPYTRSGNTYTYTVETNKKTYTFTSAKSKIYENGCFYEMPLNLAKATNTVTK